MQKYKSKINGVQLGELTYGFVKGKLEPSFEFSKDIPLVSLTTLKDIVKELEKSNVGVNKTLGHLKLMRKMGWMISKKPAKPKKLGKSKKVVKKKKS